MENKDTMHQAQDRGRRAFHEAFEYIGKAAGASVDMQRDFLKMQGDLFRAWSGARPSPGTGASGSVPDLEQFHGQWAANMERLLKRRREVLDLQYHGALETMEEVLRLAQTSTPEAFSEKMEHFFRTTLEAWHKGSEAQLLEFQDAAKSLMEMSAAPFGKSNA